MGISKSLAKRVFARGDRDQVDMISHERIRPNGEAKECACLVQQFEIDLAVPIIEENRRSTNPSLRNVMRKPGYDNPGKPAHVCSVPPSGNRCQSRLSPI